MEGIVKKRELLSSLPDIWPQPLLDEIRLANETSRRKFVVLDDDPTGTQTVHDIYLLSDWTFEKLREECRVSDTFFVLTNSRSLPPTEARQIAFEIGKNLRRVADTLGIVFSVASRSDSTLRGHYPIEVDALSEGMGLDADATILAPYFAAGGRLTINDVHYVEQDDDLVPAALTEFARDKSFAFTHSRLPDYVEEKTSGRIKAADVVCISLDTLRLSGPDGVRDILMSIGPPGVVVVNAAHERDMEVFVRGLLHAEALGKMFVYRTAADFVRIRAGLPLKPVLDADELSANTGLGGLMVVASHIARSTEQLKHALAVEGVSGIEMYVPDLLDETVRKRSIASLVERIDNLLSDGTTVVAYTSRQLEFGSTPDASLAISRQVSESICEIVRGLPRQPRFLVAKGGITSSDIATRGLSVERAFVIGQLQPGVPVWETGSESRFPEMRYVIYPGNVGPPEGLAEALRSLGVRG